MYWLRRWFWTPVRENENWAQTLVRAAGNLFRIVLTLTIVLAVSIAVMVFMQGLENQHHARVAELISVSASIDPVLIEGEEPQRCPIEYPILISVENVSDLTLMSMDIEVTARRKGASTNLLGYGEHTIRWDSIVPPQHVMASCYRVGRGPLDTSAVYSASPATYSIVLQPTEEWMLKETRAWQIVPPCKNGKDECDPWERDWRGKGPPVGSVVGRDGTIRTAD